MNDASDDAEVGSFSEEAVKLFGALSGWAVEHAGQATDGLSDLAAHAAASAQLNENLATGSAECTLCPVCRVVHAVRQLSPEVMAHLTAAAASLAKAADALTTLPDHTDEAHIDLDE
ncbi:MAG: hypothetical protein LH624_10880 [Cryobacterium sp.]|nr:hypothetical protein [Cryobacterium sp.]